MTAKTLPTDSLAAQAQHFDDVLAQWLEQPGVTTACRSRADGAISEIMPRGSCRTADVPWAASG